MAAKSICSIDGCDKVSIAVGYCDKHYRKLRKYGDPIAKSQRYGAAQIFLDQTIPQHQGDDCLIWPFCRNASGYGSIRRGGKTHLVTRLVCESVHGLPPSRRHEAAHSCGNGHLGCVNGKHLIWKTPAENVGDRLAHGTYQFGSKNPGAILSEDDVRQIRRLRGSLTRRQLSERFGISMDTVSQIYARRTWAWLD